MVCKGNHATKNEENCKRLGIPHEEKQICTPKADLTPPKADLTPSKADMTPSKAYLTPKGVGKITIH